MSRRQLFAEITGEMLEIYAKKNADYGNSFEKSLDEFGDIAFTVRASDKMERIKALMEVENQVKDESVEDTVRDLANYCVMYLVWKEQDDYKQKKLKFDEDIGSKEVRTVGNCKVCGRFVFSGQNYLTDWSGNHTCYVCMGERKYTKTDNVQPRGNRNQTVRHNVVGICHKCGTDVFETGTYRNSVWSGNLYCGTCWPLDKMEEPVV